MNGQYARQAISDPVGAFIARAKPVFIDGAWQSGVGTMTLVDPSTTAEITEFGLAGREQVDTAVAAARRAFENAEWRKMAPLQRSRLLHRFADLIERDAAVIAELEAYNGGIPVSIAQHVAVPLSVDFMRYYAGWPAHVNGAVIPTAPRAAHGAPTLTYTQKEPIGVVAQILPWNFPLIMAVIKLAPALATGCTVVLKPSELTPLTLLYLAELSIEAGIPNGVLNVLNGTGEEVGAHLASHPDVDKVAFTGSTIVGKSILAAAAGNLKKVSLELGGKSPVVIFPDADLNQAIPGAAMACFFLQGQNCMAGTRLFAHRSVYDRVMAGIEQVAKSLKIGASLAPDVIIGPLVSQRQRERVLGYISIGQEEGSELVCGGRALEGPGFFVEPTLLSNTSAKSRVFQEEIFGPVLCAQPFDDDELESLGRKINASVYGLSASVWTTNLSVAHRMASLIRAGQVGINCHGPIDVNIPLGGYRQSGWGREGGEAAINLYAESKSITAFL